MTHKTLCFPRGTVIQFTQGEYSNFGTCGLVVTLQRIDLPELARQYRAEYKPAYEGDEPELGDFASWLIAKQICAPVEYSEVYLGEYREWITELSK